jgi:hypothetical protein
MAGAGIALPIIAAASGLSGALIGGLATWLTQHGIYKRQTADADRRWRREVMYKDGTLLLSAVGRCNVAVTDLALMRLDRYDASVREVSEAVGQATILLSSQTLMYVSDWSEVHQNLVAEMAADLEVEPRKRIADRYSVPLSDAANLVRASVRRDVGLPREPGESSSPDVSSTP